MVMQNKNNKRDKRDTGKHLLLMGRANPSYNDVKIKEKTKRLKKRLLISLKNNFGIISYASARIGINNNTFYRWVKEDKCFAKEVDDMQNIFDTIVEDKLKQKILENDGYAIRYYLSHRVKKYRNRLSFNEDRQEPFSIEIVNRN